ncbi:MAG: DHH family phosphoesterase, partial [Thermoprotei archaeon]
MIREIFEAIDYIVNAREILIVSHFDADGLASAIILAHTIRKLRIPYKIKILDQLTTEDYKTLINLPHDTIIFADFGSVVSRNFQSIEKNIIIIDHHEIPDKENPFIIEINPHKYNYDGNTEISSSGLSYLIARNLNQENIILVPYALAGAYGDQQDISEERDFIGLNKIIANEGIQNGIIKRTTRLFAITPTTKLAKAIQNTTNLSEEEIRELSIPDKMIKELTQEE